ncbi:MAG TPA: ureidoglycolate lyase [Ignavibacteriales bacterium]|nr:ureidoglycolate lyase [Ignavibacteriales bacterium]
MVVKSKKIDNNNIKKFGHAVVSQTGEPSMQGETFKFWSDIADYQINGETEIGICTVYKQHVNEITGIERHMETPEILVPIDAPFILPLLKEGDNENALEAFKVDVGEAVVIDKAVWHGACFPVGKEKSSYFVIFKKGTPFNDMHKKDTNKIEIQE